MSSGYLLAQALDARLLYAVSSRRPAAKVQPCDRAHLDSESTKGLTIEPQLQRQPPM